MRSSQSARLVGASEKAPDVRGPCALWEEQGEGFRAGLVGAGAADSGKVDRSQAPKVSYAFLELFILKGPESLESVFSRNQKNQIHMFEKALWWPHGVWRVKGETESRETSKALGRVIRLRQGPQGEETDGVASQDGCRGSQAASW